MNTTTATDLPTLPVESPEFWADPSAYTEAARRQHPWLARFSQGYVIHGYNEVRDLLDDDEHLKPGFGNIADFYGVRGTMWARFMDEMLLSQSGASHDRLRASVIGAFTPRHANQSRPLMQRIISDLIDQWAPRGEFDFAYFASFFPVAVICGLLGVSAEPIPKIRTALEDQLASLTFDPELKPRFMAGWEVLWSFADRLVIDREQHGLKEELLLDELIAAKNSGQLDETELRFMVLTLVVAGYDTSKNMFTLIMYLLLDRPAMYQRCAEDKAYCKKVVEEALRHSSIATTFRTVVEEFEYGGIRFPKGTMIACAIPLTGRDPRAFPDPLDFDPERTQTNRHIAFGRGVHYCLGNFIARTQLEEGIHLIARRLKNPRVNGEVTWRPFLGAWGLRNLPITFDSENA